MDLLPITRAIVSVTDKTGLTEFCTFLANGGVQLVSTGGTARHLADAGLAVTDVSEVTGFPEIMGGRVKTLHPGVHGGILADKDNPEHLQTIAEHGISAFDMTIVNLYEFERAVEAEMPLKDAIELIDIGGPTLLRASAKNYHSVCVVPAPEHYAQLTTALQDTNMQAPLELRRMLAADTFARTSRYDGMITRYLQTASE